MNDARLDYIIKHHRQRTLRYSSNDLSKRLRFEERQWFNSKNYFADQQRQELHWMLLHKLDIRDMLKVEWTKCRDLLNL